MHRFRNLITHFYGVFERKIIYVVLIMFFCAGFFASEFISKSSSLPLASKLAPPILSRCQIKDQDINLAIQNVQAREGVVSSLVTFTPSIKNVSPTVKEITFHLVGTSGVKVDAADLVLLYSSNLAVLEIRSGLTFPSYPRKIISPDKVVVSGVATIDQKIVLGLPNTPFITLVVEKKDPQKGYITLDMSNTSVFYQGISILNQNGETAQIEL